MIFDTFDSCPTYIYTLICSEYECNIIFQKYSHITLVSSEMVGTKSHFQSSFLKSAIDLYRLYRLLSYLIGMMKYKFVSINTKKNILEK